MRDEKQARTEAAGIVPEFGGRELRSLTRNGRLVPRLGHAQAIGAIAHRLCRLIWMILHQAIRYEERGPAVSRAKTERHNFFLAGIRTRTDVHRVYRVLWRAGRYNRPHD